MTAAKWFWTGCAALVWSVTVAHGEVVADDIAVTWIAFGSDNTSGENWSHGYFYFFYDAQNMSPKSIHTVAFEYGAGACRTTPVLLSPGEKQRFSLPYPPVYCNDWHDITLLVDGIPYEMESNRSRRIRISFNPQRSRYDQTPCVLLSPGLSGNAVRLRMEELKMARKDLAFCDAQMPVAEWPDEWLAYSRFDALVLAAADMDGLSPGAAKAVDDYVRAGGRLVVAGAEGEPETRGFGMVRHIASTNVREWEDADLLSMFSDATAHRGLWRRGTESDMFKPLSGGGMLAVYLALLAVTVLLGPVLMVWLARRDKRIHAYWIAPAGAAATGLAVLAIAVLADGVTPRVDIRAMVALDTEAGMAATLSRVSAKAPFSARGGMAFSRGTEFTPNETERPLRRFGARRVDFGDFQRFGSAWLPPRTATSFVLRHAGPAPGKTLEILSETREGLVVRNALGAPVLDVHARGSGSVFYSGANIPAGAVATLKPIAFTDAAGFFASCFSDRFGMLQALAPSGAFPEHAFLATLSGAPFTESFLQTRTRDIGQTIVFGACGAGEPEGQP